MTIKRGDIWRVDFNPTKGAEIKKIRPAVVVSSDAIGILPIKIVIPVTDWKDRYAKNLWHIRIDPDGQNGLDKISAVDALQIRSVSTERFIFSCAIPKAARNPNLDRARQKRSAGDPG